MELARGGGPERRLRWGALSVPPAFSTLPATHRLLKACLTWPGSSGLSRSAATYGCLTQAITLTLACGGAQTSSPANSSCSTAARRVTACGTTRCSGCARACHAPAADMQLLIRPSKPPTAGSIRVKAAPPPAPQVRKFDGELVWRRRHYRVRRAERPGTFFFSVLDNGVISNEFWRRARAHSALIYPALPSGAGAVRLPHAFSRRPRHEAGVCARVRMRAGIACATRHAAG